MSLYDSDRVQKISTIMPNFSQVAEPGDVVRMGLKGDPLYNESAAHLGTIQNVRIGDDEDERIVSIMNNETGVVREFSSSSIKPGELWEFTDDSFKHVLEREQAKYRAEQSISSVPILEEESSYRGNDDIMSLRSEISHLRSLLNDQEMKQKDFSNVVIQTMREMASDICKMDPTGKNAGFCRVFDQQYTQMMRAESSISDADYRGTSNDDNASVASSSKYRGGDATIFSDSDSLMSDSDDSDA